MKKPLFIFIFGILLVTTFSFISAEDWGYNYLEGDLNTAQAINYSQLNVNNSQFLRGYSPLTLGSWLESSFGWIDNSVNDLENYFTKTEILNFDYYNSTDFDINDYYLKSNPFGFYNSTTLDLSNYVPYTGATKNLDLGVNNITSQNGFFNFIGSLANKITKIFTENIDVSGKINLTNGSYSNEIYTDENGTLVFYFK